MPCNTNQYKKARPVLLVVSAETALTLVLALVCSAVFEQEVVFSVILGCGLFVVPNAYFTLYAFRYKGAEWAQFITRDFYWGQMGKLALTGVAFALVFRFYPKVHAIALFSSYCLLIAFHVITARLVSNSLQQ